jgi:hypothetical protein
MRHCIRTPRTTTRCSRATVALVLALATSSVPTAAHAAPDEERAAIQELCRTGPVVFRARAAMLRGDALVGAASVLPNPTLVGEHNRSFTGPEDSETIVGLRVPLGIGGRRFVLDDAAEERRTASAADGDEILLTQALELREAMVRARAELARAEAAQRQHEKLVRLADTLAGLKKGGEASDHDRLRHGGYKAPGAPAAPPASASAAAPPPSGTAPGSFGTAPAGTTAPPGSAAPTATAPGSAAPTATAPGSAAPTATAPGSAAPTATAPGSAAPTAPKPPATAPTAPAPKKP